MSGSADDIGAPDSWEMADLDESMSRMVLLSRKPSLPSQSSPAPSSSNLNQGDGLLASAALPSSLSPAASGDRSGAMPEEALSQVDQFLREAVEKPRERLSILRMERDVEKFLRDPTQQQMEFRALPTSYLRLAAHRIAQHYCLQSLGVPDNSLPDGSSSRIVLMKTPHSRFPTVRLSDIPVNLPTGDGNVDVKLAIKQRPLKGSQSTSNLNVHTSEANHLKSVEERKEEYNRARARIFSSSSSSTGAIKKSENVPVLEDNFPYCSLAASGVDEKFTYEGSENIFGRSLSISSTASSTLNRSEGYKEPFVSRYRASNRMAIFRDREVERKDPDYDRSYDRYMQRFDPGFGFNGGHYTIQPLFSPTVNYNTEFPQLGTGHRPQISIEQQYRPMQQQIHGPWPGQTAPGAVGYGHPDGMMASFNQSNRMGSHPAPSMHMRPSQYSLQLPPGISFVHPHERAQLFPQSHQQQSEASFGLARPR